MMVILFILLGLLFILIGIWYSSIRIELIYQRLNGDDRGEIKVFALGGLLRFLWELPKMDWLGVDEGLKVEHDWKSIFPKEELVQQEEQRVTRKTIMEKIEIMKDQLKRIEDLRKIVHWFLRRVTCERLVWKTLVGTGDAAEAGFLVGIGWTLKSMLIGWLSSYLRWQKTPDIMIEPDFHQSRFDVFFHSIIRFRIGHAISAIIRMRVKDKGRERKWQIIPFKV